MSANTFEYNALICDGVSPDPGNGKVISPVGALVNVPLVTAGAETRTVAAPVGPCKIFSLTCITYVGNCVVTFPAAINATGNTIATFTAANQTITVVSVPVAGGTFRYRVLANDGTTLS